MEAAITIMGSNHAGPTLAGLTYLEDLREEAWAYLLAEEVVDTC